MVNYRRAYIPGSTWFFTVNLLQRHQNDLLIRRIDLLRDTVRAVRARYPFQIDAWVVLPEHMHAIWTLPSGEADFSTRWRLIKSGFSRGLAKTDIDPRFESPPMNEASGNGIFGNMPSVTNWTLNDMLITCILIR